MTEISKNMMMLKTQHHWMTTCLNCGRTGDFPPDYLKTKSAPMLVLKGIGTITLGRIGEDNNILRDDIVTWKKRMTDALYIGNLTYTVRPSILSEDSDASSVVYITNTEENNYVVIDAIEEKPLHNFDGKLEKEGARKDLLQLIKVLKEHDFSGALRIVNDFLEEHQSRMEKKYYSPNIEDTIATAFAMHNKGVLEMINGVFKYAVYYFKESADIKEALLGPRHNSTLESMEQLAIALYGFGYLAESHATLRTIHSRSKSPILAARIWNSLACLHYQKGDFSFAIKCAARGSQLEALDLTATISLVNRGYILLSLGREDGRRYLKIAEEKLSHWLGSENEIVQSVRYNMNS
mmetsp:Transcript_20657/g.23574  ORF Transcript_20657/g.23574 Transcript_20657/m.23574 type:complete len:351 (-) Transcript_20657:185-1237(-)